jgi:hypothetical protein
MSSSEKLTYKETLRQVFICLSEAQNPITPPPSPLHIIYVNTVYLIKQGRGGGGRVEPERRLRGNQFTKLGRNTNMTHCISIL